MVRSSDPQLPIRILNQHNRIISKARSKEAAKRFTTNVYAGLRSGFYSRTDARARANHPRFHHLYEWQQTGDDSARLYRLVSRNIGTGAFEISYEFLESSIPVPNSGHVFREKARVMEEGKPVTISPVDSNVLSFEVDGNWIVTGNDVVVPHPGGEMVAGALRSEFMYYFRPSVLMKNPAYQKALEIQKEKVLRELGRGIS